MMLSGGGGHWVNVNEIQCNVTLTMLPLLSTFQSYIFSLRCSRFAAIPSFGRLVPTQLGLPLSGNRQLVPQT